VLDDDRDLRIDDLPVDADTHNDVDLERAGQHRRARVGAENQVTSCDSEDLGEPRSGGSDPSCD
jgi:hypothetical protein